MTSRGLPFPLEGRRTDFFHIHHLPHKLNAPPRRRPDRRIYAAEKNSVMRPPGSELRRLECQPRYTSKVQFAAAGLCIQYLAVDKLFEVIYEDGELLALNKPAGLVCHPTKTDVYSSLISRVRLYLGADSRAHLINRLDRETSGVVIVAKDELTARELGKIWESREVTKQYLAIVHGFIKEQQGLIDAPLGKDNTSQVAIKDHVRADGASAATEYTVLSRFSGSPGGASERLQEFSLLRVQPRTGRKHQIRIHLAHIGHPIVGDKLYGGDEDLYLALVEGRLTAEQEQRLILSYQALHAERVCFRWRGEPMEFSAAPEPWFVAFAAG
jgi:23S rRNA pseudouridine1911/1915/1917 synthase